MKGIGSNMWRSLPLAVSSELDGRILKPVSNHLTRCIREQRLLLIESKVSNDYKYQAVNTQGGFNRTIPRLRGEFKLENDVALSLLAKHSCQAGFGCSLKRGMRQGKLRIWIRLMNCGAMDC
jgi:hypothetical protein